jgi:hypothetical protein
VDLHLQRLRTSIHSTAEQSVKLWPVACRHSTTHMGCSHAIQTLRCAPLDQQNKLGVYGVFCVIAPLCRR